MSLKSPEGRAALFAAVDGMRKQRELIGQQVTKISKLARQRIATARTPGVHGFFLSNSQGITEVNNGLDTVASHFEQYAGGPDDLAEITERSSVLDRTPGSDIVALRATTYRDGAQIVEAATTLLNRKPVWHAAPKTVKACLDHFGIPTANS